MKAFIYVLLLAAVALGAEEKKQEKRGLLGLGYGVAPAPVVSHGLGLYNHGAYGGLYGHGIYSGGLYGHGLYGHGLYGHGLYGDGLHGHGLYGHGLIAPAPLIGHGGLLGHGLWH